MQEAHPLTRWRATQDPPVTQAQLAKMIGVEEMTVWRWEKGIALPQRKYWRQIEVVTGVTIVQLAAAARDLLEARAA